MTGHTTALAAYIAGFDHRWRRGCDDTHRPTALPTWVTQDPATLEAPDLDAGRYRP